MTGLYPTRTPVGDVRAGPAGALAVTTPADLPRGVWLGASDVLGRPCPTSEPYPHIHRWVARRDCAACAQPATTEAGGTGHQPTTKEPTE